MNISSNAPRHPDTLRNATRAQDATVKRRVVGSDELSVVDPGLQDGPEFAEGRRGAHILPSEAMDPGEYELRFGRPDEERPSNFDRPRRTAAKANAQTLSRL